MREREKKQARFSKNNNFEELSGLKETHLRERFSRNFSTIMQQIHLWNIFLFIHSSSLLMSAIKKATVHFIPSVLYRSEIIPHF